jgi:hypothetical protein
MVEYISMKVMDNIVRGYEKCFFFFPQFCDGNHPQGDLAMFGYRPTMKVGIY